MHANELHAALLAKGFVLGPNGWRKVKPSYIPLPKQLSDKLPGSARRIRQNSKPLLNKLEAEYFRILNTQYPNYPRPKAQAKRFKLANGLWYKPDFTATTWPQDSGPDRETAWEVKGPHAFRGGFENLKMAASAWQEISWRLVWKDDGLWRVQIILP